VSTEVSEEHIAFICRVEEISSARNQQASLLATCSSETPVDIQLTTRRHIPEDDTLQFKLHSFTQVKAR
jgi:hypothetical protein